MVRKSAWSFKEQRQLIELARASKSLDEAVKVTGRKPETIKKMAMRARNLVQAKCRKK
jgi:hypothetical protein